MSLDKATFEEIVDTWYEPLYRFAFSLSSNETDARDLTQEAFRQLARKGHQLKDPSKAKSWLFTTLYRSFVDSCRWHSRYRHVHMNGVETELPETLPDAAQRIDSVTAREALARLPEIFRAPLTLFYLEDLSYLEIAEVLGIPPGTVMSRISRGRTQLRRLVEDEPSRDHRDQVTNGMPAKIPHPQSS
jgi:RNA polymerase sigma-70 factor (ECF subfamily)